MFKKNSWMRIERFVVIETSRLLKNHKNLPTTSRVGIKIPTVVPVPQ